MGVMLGYFLKKFSVFDRELRHGTLIFAHLAYEIHVVVGVGALYEFWKGGEFRLKGVREDVLLVGLTLVGLKGCEVVHLGTEILFYEKYLSSLKMINSD